MKEALLSIDNFSKPAYKENAKSDALLLYYIIISRRDSHPLTPGLGFEIQRYRYKDFDEMGELKNDLEEHCRQFLPFILINNVDITIQSKKCLCITISLINTVTENSDVLILEVTKEKTKLLIDLLNK